jgi:hypothetical protein
VNLQDDKGKAKTYQVRQLLEAVERRLSQLKTAVDETQSSTTLERQDSPHKKKRKKKRR